MAKRCSDQRFVQIEARLPNPRNNSRHVNQPSFRSEPKYANCAGHAKLEWLCFAPAGGIVHQLQVRKEFPGVSERRAFTLAR